MGIQFDNPYFTIYVSEKERLDVEDWMNSWFKCRIVRWQFRASDGQVFDDATEAVEHNKTVDVLARYRGKSPIPVVTISFPDGSEDSFDDFDAFSQAVYGRGECTEGTQWSHHMMHDDRAISGPGSPEMPKPKDDGFYIDPMEFYDGEG